MQPEYIELKASKGHIVISLNIVTDNVLNILDIQYENNFLKWITKQWKKSQEVLTNQLIFKNIISKQKVKWNLF